MFIHMRSSRLGKLLWSLQGILFLIFHYSYFMSWNIDILDSIMNIFMNRRQSLLTSSLIVPIRSEKWEIKVSAPELNHDYINYSDIKIRYRWNRGSGSLISLHHVRIRRPIESSCSWMLYRNPFLFLSFFHRERFIPNHKSNLSFLNSFFLSLW